MATAVPRQFEIAKLASRGGYATKTALATELRRRTEASISHNRNSAFQRIVDERRVPLRVGTIVSYVSVAQAVGILDDSLQATGPIKSDTKLDGFANYLGERVRDFAAKHGFDMDQIRDFIRKQFASQRFPIEPATPQSLYARLNPDVSEFTYYQCLLILDELSNTKFRVRSLRMLLHRDVLWGPG